MKYLQIWLGKTPDKIRKNCIYSVYEKVDFTKDEYILISDKNFLNKENITWINTKKFLKKYNNDLLVKEFLKILEFNKKETLYSDLIRFLYCCENDDVFYLDTDVNLIKKIEFNNEIYFPSVKDKRIDYFLFYSGKNRQDFFKKLIDLSLKTVLHRNNLEIRLGRGWIYFILNNFIRDVKILDSSSYEHKNLGMING